MKVVILACNKYTWLVPVALYFLKKYWPDNPYDIEIVTETNQVDGVVHYIDDISWANRLIEYIKQSKEEKFLLIMEEHFIERMINTKRVEIAESLCTGKVGCVRLNPPDKYFKTHSVRSRARDFREYPLDKPYSMSMQTAIWQKRFLLDVLRKNESIWQTEIEGSKRLGNLQSKWWILWAKSPIIDYTAGGIMKKGTLRLPIVQWVIRELLNDNKLAFIDVGELGWSLYLSAHIRWLKKNTNFTVAVISLPDRKCLYQGIADKIIDIPKAFYKKYDLKLQDSAKIRKVGWGELKEFFMPYVPRDYFIFDPTEYPYRISSDSRIFKPYEYSMPPEDGKEVIIFPRCRPGLWLKRNLPEEFYIRLIRRLCKRFPELTIRTIGTKNGAYNMEIDKLNYINWVGKSKTLQDLIDRCQSAVVAVGSQSAPPKLSLLQGVPTFIIGHQKDRHIQRDNWMNTKVGFYEIGKKEYATFNIDDCVQEVVDFIKEVQ